MKQQLIIAISGKKQAGKNTVGEFIAQHYNWLDGYSSRTVGLYSYADKLKQFCIECLGLSYGQCYGTDEEKNTLTNLKWENMPGVLTNYPMGVFLDLQNEVGCLVGKVILHEPGFMTAREVMQFFGTEIGRRMYNNIWVDSTIRQIKKDGLGIAVITDCRFPNEVHAVLNEGGWVMRLTRNPFQSDEHESEKALDQDRFNWELFTYIIDNAEMGIDETNQLVLRIIENEHEKQASERRNSVPFIVPIKQELELYPKQRIPVSD